MEACNWQHARLEYFYWMYKKQKSRDSIVNRDLYVLCLVMLRQQFGTRLKCFIIKKKSVLFV